MSAKLTSCILYLLLLYLLLLNKGKKGSHAWYQIWSQEIWTAWVPTKCSTNQTSTIFRMGTVFGKRKVGVLAQWIGSPIRHRNWCHCDCRCPSSWIHVDKIWPSMRPGNLPQWTAAFRWANFMGKHTWKLWRSMPCKFHGSIRLWSVEEKTLLLNNVCKRFWRQTLL